MYFQYLNISKYLCQYLEILVKSIKKSKSIIGSYAILYLAKNGKIILSSNRFRLGVCVWVPIFSKIGT